MKQQTLVKSEKTILTESLGGVVGYHVRHVFFFYFFALFSCFARREKTEQRTLSNYIGNTNSDPIMQY